jgi:hypothetical protein
MEHTSSREPTAIVLPPNRSFGLLFCFVFALIGVFPLLAGGGLRLWSLVASGLFGTAALLLPDALTPLNRLWMRFGALLHRIVSPIVLAVLFFLVITPFALVMRLFKRDVLLLRPDASKTSYWVDRDPPGPSPDSLNNQF